MNTLAEIPAQHLPGQGTHVDENDHQMMDHIGAAPDLRSPQILENGARDDDVAHGAHTCCGGYNLAV